MLVIDNLAEWNIIKECLRRLNHQQVYSLAEIGRMLGKSNVYREPFVTKFLNEGIFDALDGKDGNRRGFMPKSERTVYQFDRKRLVDATIEFWCDEIKKCTGKTLDVVRI